MPVIDSEESLHEAILLLEQQHRDETQKLKAAFDQVYESVKPINLLRNSLEDVAETPAGEQGSLQNLLGVGAGYLARRLIMGGTPTIAKKVLGSAIQFGIFNLVSRNHKVSDMLNNLIAKFTDKEDKKQ